jgi:Raf kinase inhibitor-like YbhB/YbcL family protein
MALHIECPEFDNGDLIPPQYTCQGADINPPLDIENIPAKAQSLVLIVDDPDAPKGTWVHWVVFNIPPTTTHIEEESIPGTEGHNDFGRNNWGGPCPPEGTGTHRYYFRLYALDTMLSLPEGALRSQVDQAMKGHVLEKAETMGRYSKG